MIGHVHVQKKSHENQNPIPSYPLPTSQPAPLDPPVTLRRAVVVSCARVVTVGAAGLMTVKAGAKAMATRHDARRTVRRSELLEAGRRHAFLNLFQFFRLP